METDDFDPFVAPLDYPMFVVTAAHGDSRAGCLVGFATQASIDPPRFLVCLSSKNHTFAVARSSGVLGVHALRRDQHELAELFGATTGDEVDKFTRCRWSAGPDGVPLLDDCESRFVGRILQRFDFGDHVGHLLEPTGVDKAGAGRVLTFQKVRDLSPGHQA